MPKKLPGSAYYSIRAPQNFYRDMRGDVELLNQHQRFSACITVILSCIDALAAGQGQATRGKFVALVEREFPDLCRALDPTVRSRSGAAVLYEQFRNGYAHLRGPKSGFAIADNQELDGAWAGRLELEGKGEFVAMNVERLVLHFLALVSRLEKGVAP